MHPDRRLRAAVRPAQRGAGQPGRVGRLAVLPAVRQPGDLRPTPRRRGRPLVDRRRRRPRSPGATWIARWCWRPPSGPRPGRRRRRRVGDGRRQPRSRARQGRAAPAAAAGDVHDRRGRDRAWSTARGRSTGSCTRCSTRSTAGWPRPAGRSAGPVVPGAAGGRSVVGLGSAPPACRRVRRVRAAPPASGPSTVPAQVWTQDEIAARLDDTVAAWRSWSELHQAYEGPWRDLVHHSGRVLQALSFQPTGAICAAATTSLPEVVGGDRNWDYRYTWVRDASFTIDALWVAACPDEADEFFAYIDRLRGRLARPGGDLQIMFGIGGERDLTERELPHLAGWRQRRPCGSATARGASSSSTSTANCSTAAHRLSDRRLLRPRSSTDRAGADHARSSSTWPTPRPGAGRRRTRASGRCEASRGTSCTRRSCAGSRSTARSRSPTGSAPPTTSRSGRRRQDEIRDGDPDDGWSDGPAPSRSPSARTTWTPPT